MDILDKFIKTAEETVQRGYYKTSLKQKLIAQKFSLIAEIKHASPSGDYDFKEIDAEKTAMIFRESGADAISCVVEPKFFKGKLSNVPLAKKSGLPVLFKDFIFCEEQIRTAKTLGADVILLIVKLANRLKLDLNSLIRTAHTLGMEVLLETYNEKEMRQALDTEADILGINNRDLQTLTVDITRTKQILDTVEIDRPLISESGIKTAEDAAFVKRAGANGVLVGTAIWLAKDIETKIRELKQGGSNE